MTKPDDKSSPDPEWAIWIILGSFLLPVFMIAMILLLGEDWSQDEYAKRSDIFLVAMVILMFSADWLIKRPLLKWLPNVMRSDPSSTMLFAGLVLYTAYENTDPNLTGWAWWRDAATEFLFVTATLMAVLAAFQIVKWAWGRWKQRKTTD